MNLQHLFGWELNRERVVHYDRHGRSQKKHTKRVQQTCAAMGNLGDLGLSHRMVTT